MQGSLPDTARSSVEHRRPERGGTKGNASPMVANGRDRTKVIHVEKFMRTWRESSLRLYVVIKAEHAGNKGEDD